MSLTCFPDYTTPLIEADKYCLNTYQHLSLFIYHLEQLLSRVGLHRFELWAPGPKPDMFTVLHHNPIQMRMPGFEPESHAPKAQMFTINTTFSWWNQNDFKSCEWIEHSFQDIPSAVFQLYRHRDILSAPYRIRTDKTRSSAPDFTI